MDKYEVKGRLVNLHSGVVVLSKAMTEKLAKRLKDKGDGTFQIAEPLQLPNGAQFFYDGAPLHPVNVRHLGNFDPSRGGLDGTETEAESQPVITRDYLEAHHADLLKTIHGEGFEEGKAAGYDEGREAGIKEGKAAGYDEGREAGIKEGIESVQEGGTGTLELTGDGGDGHMPERMAHIVDACGKVEGADMTKSSGPKLAALKAAAGLDDVTDAERDEAWQLFQSQQGEGND